MNCKKCKREIPDNSIFCNWCGSRQIKDGDAITVPRAKKLPSGSWRIQLMVGGVSHSVTADTEKEATKQAAEIKRRYAETKKTPSVMTLGEAVEKYITDRKNVLSPSTLRSYESYRAFRFQELQKRRICDITPTVLQEVINKEAETVAAKTIKNALGLLATAAESVAGVKLGGTTPKVAKHPHPFLEPEEIETFLNHIRGERHEAAILLGLHSLRLSEILAITPEDIDRKKKIIHVNSAVVYDGKGLVERDVNKTYRSTRDIPILIPRLLEVTDQLPVTIAASTLYRRVEKICKQMGRENIGMHGLRHTFASLAASDGVRMPQAECMRLGGWSSPAVLTEIYTHVASADRRKSQESMLQFFTQISHGTEKTQ